jgi:hypothetical protein
VKGIHVPVETGWNRVRSTRMLGETQQRHGAQFDLLRERHPRLFAARSRTAAAPPPRFAASCSSRLVERLPVADYTKQRLFRAINRGAAVRARL